jgi:uncharacterized protein YbjT (DUF2867 family)
LTILVLGAAGDQGQPLLRALRAAGHPVRAGTRDPAAFPATDGVQPVLARLDDASTLESAAAGCDAIAMHLPFTFDRAYARAMGAAIAEGARRARVGRIVFHTSCVVIDRELGIDGHDARRDIESALAASGVPFTFLRSTVFMENIIRPWVKPAILAHGVFAYPAGPGLRISFVTLGDVADAMVRGVEGQLPERLLLGGPEALTGADVAERLAAAIGRPVRFESLSPDAFASAMSELVTGSPAFEPGGLYDRMAAMYRWYNGTHPSPLIADPAVAEAALGRPATPLAQWARHQDWSG